MLKIAALNFARKFAVSDFKASDGWLSKFKKRNHIKLKNLSGGFYLTQFYFSKKVL